MLFSIGEFREPDAVRIQLPMRQVILQGIKRAPNAKAMVARLGGKETLLEPCYRSEDLIEIALDGEEYRLLCLVDGRRTLYEICVGGPLSASENGKILYAFQVLQLIRRAAAAPPAGNSVSSQLDTTGAIKIRLKTQGDKWSG